MASGFPGERDVAEMFGFDPERWSNDRKGRKAAMRERGQTSKGRDKAAGMANNFIGEGVRLAEQGINAQMRGVHTAEQMADRGKRKVEVTETYTKDAEDLKAESREDDGMSF